MTYEEFKARAEEIAKDFPIGTASAAKRGSSPKYPYVGVIANYFGRGGTHNPLGRSAFATREEAAAAVQAYIDDLRSHILTELMAPRMRANREQHGLPREIPSE